MSDWKRNRLRVLRAERRVAQHDIAAKLGMSQSMYWQYESGLREPDDALKSRIAKALRVPVVDLMPATGEAVA